MDSLPFMSHPLPQLDDLYRLWRRSKLQGPEQFLLNSHRFVDQNTLDRHGTRLRVLQGVLDETGVAVLSRIRWECMYSIVFCCVYPADLRCPSEKAVGMPPPAG